MNRNDQSSISPRELLCSYEACLERLDNAVSMVNSIDLTTEEFRHSIQTTFSDLKSLILEMAANGHLALLSEVSKHKDKMIDCVRRLRHEEDMQVFAEELSKEFAVDKEFLSFVTHATKKTDSKMLEQSISCSLDPGLDLKNYINQNTGEPILELLPAAFLSAKHLCARERISVAQTLLRKLQNHLQDRSELPEAIAWCQEFNSIIMPVVLEVLVDANELRANVSCSHEEKQMIKSVAFPAEFLVGIKCCTPENILNELIKIAIEFPRGYMAYKNLEALGASKSLDWHIDEQKSLPAFDKLVKLHEYAIATPGAKVDLGIFEYQVAKRIAGLYIELLENPITNDAEATDKKLAIFGGLMKCINKNDMKDVREMIIGSKIPRSIFRSYPELLGQSFINDLGM